MSAVRRVVRFVSIIKIVSDQRKRAYGSSSRYTSWKTLCQSENVMSELSGYRLIEVAGDDA